MAITFRLVLASRTTSGKKRLIALSGTITLRGSVLSEVAEDEELSPAIDAAQTPAVEAAPQDTVDEAAAQAESAPVEKGQQP